MKILATGIVAALAIVGSTNVQAASGVIEFEGFTITYSESGLWSEAPGRNYERSRMISNATVDLLHGGAVTKNKGGLDFNEGVAAFGASAWPGLESYAGSGDGALRATLSYTVQAKQGWQLMSAYAHQAQNGVYLDVEKESPYAETALGNNATSISRPMFDSSGQLTGYSVSYMIDNFHATPLTGMTGSFSMDIDPSTIGCPPFADGAGGGAFYVGAMALRTVSTVPSRNPTS